MNIRVITTVVRTNQYKVFILGIAISVVPLLSSCYEPPEPQVENGSIIENVKDTEIEVQVNDTGEN